MANAKLIRLMRQICRAPSEALRADGKLRGVVKALARAGQSGLDAIVATHGDPCPPGQDARDVMEAIESIYWEMGRCNPLALVAAFRHDANTPRSSIVSGMQNAKGDVVIDCLLQALNDADAWVRYCAVNSLIGLRHPKSKPAIFRAILDRSDRTRYSIVEAVNTCDFFRDPAAIPALRRLLQYKHLQERSSGTWAHATAAMQRLERESTNQPVLEANYSWSKVTSRGLARLRSLPHLQSLDLSETRVSDEALKHVSRLSDLRTLNISNTRITPQGLKHLQRLKTAAVTVARRQPYEPEPGPAAGARTVEVAPGAGSGRNERAGWRPGPSCAAEELARAEIVLSHRGCRLGEPAAAQTIGIAAAL